MTKRSTGRLMPAEAASRPEFWAKVNLLGECWEWGAATTEWGYGKLSYSGHTFAAHRCSYEYAFGQLPKGLWVLHHCDNPPCVNPAHLFLGTPKDNTADMHAKGRAARMGPRGEASASARLTDSDVVAIRERFALGATPLALASEYGVTNSTVNGILRGKRWQHVGGPICTRDRRGEHRRKAGLA